MMWGWRGEERVMGEGSQSLSRACESVTMKLIILYNYYIIISCNYKLYLLYANNLYNYYILIKLFPKSCFGGFVMEGLKGLESR